MIPLIINIIAQKLRTGVMMNGTIRRMAGVAALVLAVAGCAAKPVPVSPLGQKTIGPKGILTLIDFGRLGNQPFTMLTSLYAYPENGCVAVCGTIRVLAKSDVSANVRDGLSYRKTILTLGQKDGGNPLVLSPQFLPVTYQQSIDGKFKPADIGASVANCVQTESPWDKSWNDLGYSGKLTLFMREDVRSMP